MEATGFMKPSLLSTIYHGVKLLHCYFEEQPRRMWLGRPGEGMGLSNQLAGLVFCVASGHSMKRCILKVNGETVARGRLAIMIWTVENAPKTLNEAVRLMLQWEKENPEKAAEMSAK